jgi:hypothetical protein
MLSYKDQLLDLNPEYTTWLSNKIEPMVEFPTAWMDDHVYSLNSHGVRCDEFYEIPKADHILFAGCEYTLPIAQDLEDSWAYSLYKYYLGATGTFRSLSYPGADPQKIVANVIKYVDLYGAPSKMFVLMPEIIRQYGYWQEGKVYKPKMYRQLKSEDGIEHNLMAQPNDVPLQLLALNYIRSVRILESFCSATGINLFWTTWDKDTSDLLDEISFKNFFKTQEDLNTQEQIYKHFINKIRSKNE